MDSVARVVYPVVYLGTVLGSFYHCKYSQLECLAHARAKGYSGWLTRLTRSTQHFTMYAMLWLVLALLTGHRQTTCVAMVLGTMVMVQYYAFILYDPTLLSYEDAEFTRLVATVLPPRSKMVFVWVGLTFQHLVCPLHLWLTTDTKHEPLDMLWSLAAFHAYVRWNAFCWRVQGRPAYPAQQEYVDRGVYDSVVALTYVQLVLIALMIVLWR